MDNNTKGLVAVGLTLGAVGLAYYFLVYRKDEVGGDNSSDNFKALQDNIGAKPNKQNIVIAPFNEKKNLAQFYTNNRVIIFDKNNKVIVKGSYSDGGKSISLDNGKQIDSGTVWGNLLQTIK